MPSDKVLCPQKHTLRLGEIRTLAVDFGENTAGSETGVLRNGDTIATIAEIEVTERPTDADDPSIYGAAVNSSVITVNGRSCSPGEAITFKAAAGETSSSAGDPPLVGDYRIKVTVVTTNSERISRDLLLEVAE